MGLRGPAKEYHRETRFDLTDAQLLHLRMRAVAANTSVAAVLRELVDKDRKEMSNGRRVRPRSARRAS